MISFQTIEFMNIKIGILEINETEFFFVHYLQSPIIHSFIQNDHYHHHVIIVYTKHNLWWENSKKKTMTLYMTNYGLAILSLFNLSANNTNLIRQHRQQQQQQKQ